MSKKVIICFEGVEASGKSLHLKNAAFFLKKRKIPFLKLREPGGTKNSEKMIPETSFTKKIYSGMLKFTNSKKKIFTFRRYQMN